MTVNEFVLRACGFFRVPDSPACVSGIYEVKTDDTHARIWLSETLGRWPSWKNA